MGNREKRKKRERQVRKKLARKRHAGSVANIRLPPPGAPQPPKSFTVTYATPEALAAVGPLVQASWSVPPALADKLRQAGKAIPPPVAGAMLIDTGATRTCMALDVANDLGLTATGVGKTYGAGGLHTNRVFEANLEISITDSFGNQTHVQSYQQVMGIPDLQAPFAHLGVLSGGKQTRLIGLLGRDFMRHTTLVYRGSAGNFELVLDLKSMPRSTP